MKKICKNCKNWEQSQDYVGAKYGKCEEIKGKIMLNVTYGWEVYSLDSIDTDEDFYCNLYKE